MKTARITLLVAAIAGMACLSSAARAGSIAIDFVGGSPPGDNGFEGGGAVTAMQPNEVAGVVPQAFWNDAGTSGQGNINVNAVGNLPAGSLVNNSGATVPNASVAWSSFNSFSTLTPDIAGNDRMMRGYIDTANNDPYTSSDALVTVSNLPNAYASGGFNLYVYYDGLINVGAANRVGQYEIFNGPDTSGSLLGTIYGADTESFDGTFVQANGTSATNATSGNYIEFTGLHASTFTLQAFGVAGDVPRAPINGFQIVAETPEPSSLVLLAIGGMTLAIVARSRFLARSARRDGD
jgi:hypothetical protein